MSLLVSWMRSSWASLSTCTRSSITSRCRWPSSLRMSAGRRIGVDTRRTSRRTDGALTGDEVDSCAMSAPGSFVACVSESVSTTRSASEKNDPAEPDPDESEPLGRRSMADEEELDCAAVRLFELVAGVMVAEVVALSLLWSASSLLSSARVPSRRKARETSSNEW